MKRLCCYFLTILFVPATLAQLVEFPVGPGHNTTKKEHPNARIQATALTLPFWDDFSYTDTLTYPKEDLWQYGQSVFLNNGLGIKPPSKNVVSLDGVDSLGKPYNVNDILAKGYADKLVSLPINMDATAVDPSLRNTVYFSFYYQVKGRGELPDTGDQLVLLFKDSSDRWIPVYTVENDASLQPDIFYQVIFPIPATRYFHDDFQFRFQNFARLSGPYDTWNVDYVYLNKNRNATDTSYPDRTITSSLTSLFVDYYALPADHFLQDPSVNLKKPSIELHNLRVDPPGQPLNYTTTATFTAYINQASTVTSRLLDNFTSIGNAILPLEYINLSLNQIPVAGDFDPGADSIEVNLEFDLTTKDNLPIPPKALGDYDSAVYYPIDFRHSDTLRTKYTLSSYYAYDDGIAEYGAGLNQAGSYAAVKFKMKSAVPDTLVYVDIYFPSFGDNTNQTMQLQIRTDLSDAPGSIQYFQNIQVKRTSQNKFTRYKLDPSLVVSGDFYVVWKQLVTIATPIGLDKNNDTASTTTFFNTTGTWVQNVSVKGSLMIHPGFGKPTSGVVTGIASPEKENHIYPNPTSRTCYLPSAAEQVMAFDVTGRFIQTEISQLGDRKSISFQTGVNGVTLIRYFLDGKCHVEKIMVRPE